ncbi:DUF763 domain-containing protein [Ignisphaera sp. 4213-co]|uniref:DUF763 domain-containing protein n=1 Tax=Ignisphaera cupida TaxID=3050454 RepID=A0ABD4Z7X9_9CREN|nr:DUF763 domain-containing protein [Ignisphaera sp. 4213-co]MDK6029042.1 DUF763 domain-containing protein [Ignisphaera sp. 4213-co]
METAFAELILHEGKVPQYLLRYMRKLSHAILNYIHEVFGPEEIVKRVADPFWFQAFNNVIGMDWDSSGATTVVIYMLKSFANPSSFKDLGIAVLGGKGEDSRSVVNEVREIGDRIDANYIEAVSRLGAKIDGVALQDGYSLYIHSIVVSEKGLWTIVQQGMNVSTKLARRYHIHGNSMIRISGDPHSGIACNSIGVAINLIDSEAEKSRKTILDIVLSTPYSSILRDIALINRMIRGDKGLEQWIAQRSPFLQQNIQSNDNVHRIGHLFYRPVTNIARIENVLKKLTEIKPQTFEELLLFKGLGPETLRALALVADVIYHSKPSFKDPVTHPLDPFIYSYAHGGKDGIPYPIKIELMKQTINFLEEAIQESKIDNNTKKKALERLYKLFKDIVNQ